MNFEQLDLFALAPELVLPEKKDVVQSKKPKMRIQLKPVVMQQNKADEKPVIKNEPAITTDIKPAPINTSSNKQKKKSYKEIYTAIELINVPDDETLNQKLYYTTGEVAGWFNVAAYQIRFWENEFDILQPRKNKKGDRLFRVEDIKNLQLIYYLLRNRKFSIEGAKEFLKANKHKTELHLQIIESLTKFRSFLIDLKANLAL